MNEVVTVRAHVRRKKKVPDPFAAEISRRMEERLGNKLVKAVEKELSEQSVIDKVLAWLEMWKP